MATYNESRLSYYQKNRYPQRRGNLAVKDISEINAYSTPKDISEFVSLKMKEFIESQLDKKGKNDLKISKQ
jgi:hypothetical protein